MIGHGTMSFIADNGDVLYGPWMDDLRIFVLDRARSSRYSMCCVLPEYNKITLLEILV